MKAVVIVLAVVLGCLGFGAVSLFLAYQDMHNTSMNFENDIKKLNLMSENVLSTTTIKLQDAVGLNKQYTESLKEVVRAAVEGRYGKNGSGAAMQWIQEQNPTVDSKLFMKVHDIIDGGGTEFKISQDRKIELCTEYEKMRDLLVRGFFMKLAGFPKKDVEQMCILVSDEASAAAFKTGKREATIK